MSENAGAGKRYGGIGLEHGTRNNMRIVVALAKGFKRMNVFMIDYVF